MKYLSILMVGLALVVGGCGDKVSVTEKKQSEDEETKTTTTVASVLEAEDEVNHDEAEVERLKREIEALNAKKEINRLREELAELKKEPSPKPLLGKAKFSAKLLKEFIPLVIQKSKADIKDQFGAPDRTDDNDNLWQYRDITIHPVTEKVDNLHIAFKTNEYFSKGVIMGRVAMIRAGNSKKVFLADYIELLNRGFLAEYLKAEALAESNKAHNREVLSDRLEYREGITYLKGETDPFTGTQIVMEKGVKKASISYINGQSHGDTIVYYIDGREKVVGPMIIGLKHGTHVFYPENGSKSLKIVFKFGKEISRSF